MDENNLILPLVLARLQQKDVSVLLRANSNLLAELIQFFPFLCVVAVDLGPWELGLLGLLLCGNGHGGWNGILVLVGLDDVADLTASICE